MHLRCPRKRRGRRESRVPSAPAVVCTKMHTGDHRCAGTPGLPCAMVLRLISCSPRRRIRLATVADGLAIHRKPGWALVNLHQLDTSNGCQDHTALPSAASSSQPLRPAVYHRKKFRPRRLSAVRLRAVARSRAEARPANTSRARRCRVHRIPHPSSVTIAIRPSQRAWDGASR
jgi:hypothetical protein